MNVPKSPGLLSDFLSSPVSSERIHYQVTLNANNKITEVQHFSRML